MIRVWNRVMVVVHVRVRDIRLVLGIGLVLGLRLVFGLALGCVTPRPAWANSGPIVGLADTAHR